MRKLSPVQMAGIFFGCGCLIFFGLFGGMLGISAYALNNPGLFTNNPNGNSSGGATSGATIPGTTATLTIKNGNVIPSPTPTSGGVTITIPTTKGKSGAEDSIATLNAHGEHLTFQSYCNAAENDYYINMRWPYVEWAWNGTSRSADSTVAYYARKRVVVHNPKTNKSIIAAICESGPAPWTGSSISRTSPPSYWQGFYRFDPPQYTAGFVGRVSGLSPRPWSDLGAQENDILEYGFAVDQNIAVGPVK